MNKWVRRPRKVTRQSPEPVAYRRFLSPFLACCHATVSNISQRTRDTSSTEYLLTNSWERETSPNVSRAANRQNARRRTALPVSYFQFSPPSNEKQNGNVGDSQFAISPVTFSSQSWRSGFFSALAMRSAPIRAIDIAGSQYRHVFVQQLNQFLQVTLVRSFNRLRRALG